MLNLTQENKPSKTSYWAIFLIASLCVTNYLALFNNDFRQLFSASPEPNKPPNSTVTQQEVAQLVLTAGLLGISTIEVADNVKGLIEQRKSLEAERTDLSNNLAKEKSAYQALSKEHDTLNQRHVELGKAKLDQENRTKIAAKTLSDKVATRAGKSVARHVTGAAGESIPVLGTALIAGMLALDVKDACDLVKEVNEMNQAIGVLTEDEHKICGVEVPTHQQLAASVATNWKKAYQVAAEAIGMRPTLPNVSWSEVKTPVCALLQPGYVVLGVAIC